MLEHNTHSVSCNDSIFFGGFGGGGGGGARGGGGGGGAGGAEAKREGATKRNTESTFSVGKKNNWM